MKFLADLKVPDVASLNVNKCTNYTSNNTAVELLDVISEVIDNKVTEQIRESPVVTILCDESRYNDSPQIGDQLPNCRSTQTLAPKTLFLTDLRITDGTGKGIFKAIKDHVESRGELIMNVTTLGMDGAAVMTGRKEGLLCVYPKSATRTVQHTDWRYEPSRQHPKFMQTKVFHETVQQIYLDFGRRPQQFMLSRCSKSLDFFRATV